MGYGPREGGVQRRARLRPGAEAAGRITAHADVQDLFNPGGSQQHEKAQELIGALLTEEPAGGVPDPAPAASTAPRSLAKPPVRKLAKDLGIDLASVTPTGEGGTVTRGDVEAAAADVVTGAAAVPRSSARTGSASGASRSRVSAR